MKWSNKFPSLFNILFGIFIGYVCLSMWNIVKLFQAPHCTIQSECLQPTIGTNIKYQLLVYTSITHAIRNQQALSLIHYEKKFDFNLNKEHQISLPIPKRTQQNGTLYLHLFLTPVKHSTHNLNQILQDEYTVYELLPLTEYKIPEAQVFNLLGDNGDHNDSTKKSNTKKANKPVKPVTHMYSLIYFNILNDPISLPATAIPHEIAQYLRVTSSRKYLPLVHFDQMNLRIKNLREITKATTMLNFTLGYSPISYGKLRLWTQFERSFSSMHELGFTKKDVDEVKGIFSDSNLYLLSVTFIVSTLHLIFDFLAFKNDISFWRGLDKMVGISPSTVAWRAFAQIVVFMYLLEEKTSLLVLIPAGLGAILEFWKVTKTFNVRVKFWLASNNQYTVEEVKTQHLDSEGFKYLTYVLYPLCIVGAVYSLVYVPHKSWYSWIINSLVNGVYAFGFLFMLPQLFINYKLKSVAHLPWRAFMYKAFNTFIDDLFAFIITMPTSHRVACFRDDIVFVIYLYQKWLYPVDKTRLNEYGQNGEKTNKSKKE